MAEVRLPKLDAAMKEAIIIEWLKQEGDPVAEGEPLVQLETDKAVGELPSPVSGVVRRVLHPQGARVAVDTVLAVIE
ncbi:MAG TPA: biotin attachment protein [Chloroflexi bacterium]|jgi:pyruvate dehydrogenase E2 component (dihydrolipoamide acetyltransferase)|nr:biotin attachment protein [Chloroflexota bacterium]